jgi:GT2 family glycosyltransferase
MEPLVTIVIINWNGLKDTDQCLKSLAKVSYTNYKIIVIDNGSENQEAAKIKSQHPDIVLIANSYNKGFAAACNQGIEKAIELAADYVLLLNNDTVAEEHFLQHLVKYAGNNSNVILSPKILYAGTSIVQNLGGRLIPLIGGSINIGKGKPGANYTKPLSPDFLSGCAIFIPSQAIRQVGMLDPIYFAYYEDADWCYRAKSAGYRLVVLPESIIWHKHSRSSKNAQEKKFYYISRNSIIFAKKNLHGLKKAVWILAAIVVAGMYTFIFKYNKSIRRARWNGVKQGLAAVL